MLCIIGEQRIWLEPDSLSSNKLSEHKCIQLHIGVCIPISPYTSCIQSCIQSLTVNSYIKEHNWLRPPRGSVTCVKLLSSKLQTLCHLSNSIPADTVHTLKPSWTNDSVFLIHFLPGATKKVQFSTQELPGANIHKAHNTGYTRDGGVGALGPDQYECVRPNWLS